MSGGGQNSPVNNVSPKNSVEQVTMQPFHVLEALQVRFRGESYSPAGTLFTSE